MSNNNVVNIKTLTDLKRVEVGTPVTVLNHWFSGVKESRVIVAVQTNALYTGIPVSLEEKEYLIANRGYFSSNFVTIGSVTYTKVRIGFQKASTMRFLGNRVQFLAYLVPPRYDYECPYVAPSPEFREGEVWLELIF